MGAFREQLSEANGAFADVFRNRELKRINLALAASVIGDWAYGMAVSIWAYQEGGATAVGVFGVVRYVLMAAFAPVMATFADRIEKKTVMIAADVSRLVLVVIAAGFVAADGPALVIYALALLVSVIGSGFRPAQASLIPLLANDPKELTGANVVASTIESVGFFLGPAIGAGLLAVADIPEVYLFNAATFLASTLLLVGLKSPERSVDEAADALDDGEAEGTSEDEGGFFREMMGGFRTVIGDRDLRLICGLYILQTIVAGASLVFEVAIVFDLLQRSESTIGVLGAIMGVGGLLGGVVAMMLATRGRIAVDFGLGVLLWAAPLLLIVAWPTLASAAVAMFLIGLANSIVDINAYTIVQRVTPSAVMGRVFGALESFVIAGMAFGALIMPLMIETIGLRSGLAVLGIVVGTLTLLALRALDRIDHTALAPVGLPLLEGITMLAVLPPATLERLARSLVPLTVPAGVEVFHEGDIGDRYWIIESGRVAVSRDGTVLHEQGPGEGFGEVALLRDVPRTATITALEDLSLLGIERDVFLPAVTGHGDAAEQAELVMTRWVGLT